MIEKIQEPSTQRLATDVGPFAIVPMWLLVSGVSSRAIHLFGVLAGKYADREHVAFPSRALLAADLDCSTDSVDRAAQELIDVGALGVTRRQLESGDFTTNLYQLFFAAPVKEGGRKGAHTPSSRTGADRVAAPVPRGSRTGAETGTIPTDPEVHTPRAREDDRKQGSLIERGEGARWAKDQDRAHQGHHPEICNWRGTTKGICMPALLVSKFAEKLIGVDPDRAIADVIAWAQGDSPPPGTVGDGDDFKFWRERWNATRATAPGTRAGAREEKSRVAGAAETDAFLDELMSKRTKP